MLKSIILYNSINICSYYVCSAIHETKKPHCVKINIFLNLAVPIVFKCFELGLYCNISSDNSNHSEKPMTEANDSKV